MNTRVADAPRWSWGEAAFCFVLAFIASVIDTDAEASPFPDADDCLPPHTRVWLRDELGVSIVVCDRGEPGPAPDLVFRSDFED